MYLQFEEIDSFLKFFQHNGISVVMLGDNHAVPYVGREMIFKESVTRLFCAYQKSLVVSGVAGSGKTSFVHALANNLRNSHSPLLSKQFIFEINVGNLVSGTALRGDFEKKINFLLEHFLKYENVILFIDEAHVMSHTNSDGGIGMMDLIKPFILGKNLRLIIVTTEKEVELLRRDEAFFRRFHHVKLGMLTAEDKREAMKKHLKYLENYHGVRHCLDLTLLQEDENLSDLINQIDFLLAEEKLKNVV